MIAAPGIRISPGAGFEDSEGDRFVVVGLGPDDKVRVRLPGRYEYWKLDKLYKRLQGAAIIPEEEEDASDDDA